MSEGTYSNCTIIVKDSAGNASNTLEITSFVVPPFYFAVGTGITLKSSDGTSWSSVTTSASDNNSGGGFNNQLNDISYGSSTYVIVGENSSGSSGAIYTSSDGSSWTLRSSGTSNSLNGVTYGNMSQFSQIKD